MLHRAKQLAVAMLASFALNVAVKAENDAESAMLDQPGQDVSSNSLYESEFKYPAIAKILASSKEYDGISFAIIHGSTPIIEDVNGAAQGMKNYILSKLDGVEANRVNFVVEESEHVAPTLVAFAAYQNGTPVMERDSVGFLVNVKKAQSLLNQAITDFKYTTDGLDLALN